MSYKDQERFGQILYDNLSYENMVTFILECETELFKKGGLYIDEVFYSKNWKYLSNNEKIDILNILNIYNSRYSDNTYIEALWESPEIQNWVKNNLPRAYSDRHIQDTETY